MWENISAARLHVSRKSHTDVRFLKKLLFKNNNAYSSLSSICEFILGPIRDVYYSGILTGLANTPEKLIYAQFPGNFLVQQPGSGCYTQVLQAFFSYFP
jgi:hypothetical protein